MPPGVPFTLMPSFYIDKRLCTVCLGAKRLGGEPCEWCNGTGAEPPPERIVNRTLGREAVPQLPNLGDPFPAEKP